MIAEKYAWDELGLIHRSYTPRNELRGHVIGNISKRVTDATADGGGTYPSLLAVLGIPLRLTTSSGLAKRFGKFVLAFAAGQIELLHGKGISGTTHVGNRPGF